MPSFFVRKIFRSLLVFCVIMWYNRQVRICLMDPPGRVKNNVLRREENE